MCAIFDTAIRIACEDGIATVNFGASLGKPTLEEFKESWGAAPRTCWRFEWQNPVWAMAARARSLSRRARRVLRERLAVTR